MRTAALTIVLLLLAGRASAQEVFVRYTEDAWATTYCQTRPLTWYSGEMPESARGMVDAHEAQHRRDMARFITCAGFAEWLNGEKERRVQIEARAFCAAALYLVRFRDLSFPDAVWNQARAFVGYVLEWDRADAASAIYANCP